MDFENKIKLLTKQIKKVNDAELYKSMLEVRAEILIILEENKSLKEELEQLEGKLKTMEEKMKIMRSLKLENSVYWAFSDKGDQQGPFCPNCWNAKQILVPMEKDITRNRAYNKCPDCLLVIRA